SFTGIIGGAGTNQNKLALTVNMTSASSTTLLNSNTYIGNTTVTGGTLAIGSGTVKGSIVSPNVSVASGAALQIAALGAVSSSTNLSNAGFVNILAPATTVATLNGSGTISLATSTTPTVLTITGGGNYSGNLISGAGGGSLVIAGGSLILSGSNSYKGSTTVQSGMLTLTGPNAWAPALNGPGPSILSGGKMVLDYSADASTDPVATIQSLLTTTAFNTGFSSGQIQTPAADAHHTIGWKDDTVAHQLTVAYTWLGDANLDGQVSTADFTALAANFQVPGTGAVWAQGDFNYDGVINALDFNA